MADFNALEALINAHIKKNGVQAITGNILNGILRGMVSALGKGYTIAGVAVPSSDPGTMTGPLAYLAYTAGTYTHFGGLEVGQGEVAMLIYNEAVWHKEVLFSLAASATIDGNVGTPEVGVSFVDGLLTFDFRNMKGNPGDAAGFGTINATVDGNVGTPGVSVQSSGPDTAKNITFQFTNLKGETGVTSVVATVDNTVGTPTCTVSLVGQQLTLAFSGLKGAQGDTGVSADYPIAIVNNLTTNDPTQALSAAMGVQLEAEVSQLEAEVNGITIPITETGKYINTSTGVGNQIGAVTANASYSYMRFPVNPGDIVIVNGTGGSGPRLWAFIDSNEIILSVSNASVSGSNLQLIAPNNSAEIIINTSNTLVPSLYYDKDSLRGELDRVSRVVGVVSKDVESIKNAVQINEQTEFVTNTANKIVSSSNGAFQDDTNNSPTAHSDIPVIPGTKMVLQLVDVPLASGRGLAFYNASGSYISGVAYVANTLKYIFEVPDGADKMALTSFNGNGFLLSIYTNDVVVFRSLNDKIDEKGWELEYNLAVEKLTSGKFFNVSTHLFVDNASYGYYTVYLRPGTKFSVNPNVTNSAVGIGFFDNNGVFISGVGYTGGEVSATMPDNALYAVITRQMYLPIDAKIYYNDVNVLQKVLYNPDAPTKPLAKVGFAPSFISMFKKIVHIGDSLTRGQYNTTSPDANGADLPDCSRPVFMGRMIGNQNVNLGIGGSAAALSSAHPWLTEAQSGYIFPWTDFTNPGDCYIVALGTNDIIQLGSFTGDVSTDIDVADYHNNATTSVGGYATIIQMILEMQPKAKIFCATIPNTRNDATTRVAANTKIKAVAELFGCYVIDLATFAESEGGDFAKYYKNGSHNNALGYLKRAQQYIAYIDWIIENNLDDFRNIQFIGTNYDYQQ